MMLVWLEIVAWIVGMIMLTVMGANFMFNDRYARAVLMLALLVVMALGAVNRAYGSVESAHTDYANRCRAHAGTPAKIQSSMLCQGPDGRFVDVRW